MTRVKVCGITSLEDAAMAASLGADAVGFVFAPGPRRIIPAVARRISTELPAFIHRVGVFVNEDPLLAGRIALECGLTALQFHGTEPPGYLSLFSLPCIKAFRIAPEGPLPDLSGYRASAYLFEGYVLGRWGGTGKTADWERISRIAVSGPMIVAGGLTPSNVRQVLSRLRPYGVDVSSGVECAPGRKDPQRLREFIAEVRRFDREEG